MGRGGSGGGERAAGARGAPDPQPRERAGIHPPGRPAVTSGAKGAAGAAAGLGSRTRRAWPPSSSCRRRPVTPTRRPRSDCGRLRWRRQQEAGGVALLAAVLHRLPGPAQGLRVPGSGLGCWGFFPLLLRLGSHAVLMVT